jgi:hypothetical protein
MMTKNTAVMEDEMPDTTDDDFFDLVPADIPKANREKDSIYGGLLEKFAKYDKTSAEVKSNKKPTAVMNGLRHAITVRNLNDEIAVVTRSGKIYLKKKTQKSI